MEATEAMTTTLSTDQPTDFILVEITIKTWDDETENSAAENFLN